MATLLEARRVLREAAPEWALAAVLLSGLALGLLASLSFAQAVPFPATSYARTGVVGWVTVYEYPKSREQVVYAGSVLLTLGAILAAVAVWLAMAWRLRTARTDLTRALAWASLPFLASGPGLAWALLQPRYAAWILMGTLAAIVAGGTATRALARSGGAADPPSEPLLSEQVLPRSEGLVEAVGLVLLAGLAAGFFVPLAVPTGIAPHLAAAWWVWPIALGIAWRLDAQRVARRTGEPLRAALRNGALACAPLLLLLANPFLIDFRGPRVVVTIVSATTFVCAWVIVRRRRKEAPAWALSALVLAALAAFAALRATDPNDAGYLVWPGDGDHLLAWLHEGRVGRWVYRDFWFPYGPLMYLLDWASMRLCGLDRYLLPSTIFSSVLVAIGMAKGARLVVRTWPAQVAGSLFLFFVWPPNSVTLRVYLGLAALVCAVRAAERGSVRWLAASGGVLAIAFLYSHEVAIVAGLAAPPAMCWAAGNLRKGLRAVAWMAAGLAAVLLPVTIGAGALGVLLPYLRSSFGLVAVADLCCGAPYPSLIRQLPEPGMPVKDAVRAVARLLVGGLTRDFYLPPVILGLGVVALAIRYARGSRRRAEDAMLLALVLMGLGLFRVALGRSEEGHARFAAVPGLLVALVVLDRLALAAWRWARRPAQWWPALGAAIAFAALALALRLPFELRHGLGYAITKFKDYHAEIPRSDSHRPVWGWNGVRSRRGELFFFPEAVAGTVEATRAYLERHTLPREGVFAFPYAFRYNVLLNRACPVSFGPALWGAAARPEDRRRLVDELAARRVRYVVYDDSEWADLDGVAWTDRFPEVAAYLFERYDVEKQVGPVSVLRLREGPPRQRPSVIEVGRLEQRLNLPSGWYAPQRVAGRSMRWMAPSATAWLSVPAGSSAFFVEADVYPTSPRLARRLSVFIGSRRLDPIELSEHEGYTTLRFPLAPGIAPGPVTVRLEVEKPFPAADLRRLGLMVERVGFE